MVSRSTRPRAVPWLVGAQVISLAAAVCLGVVGLQAQASVPADAEYVTSKICGMCHKAQATAWAPTRHAKTTPPADGTEPWKHVTGYDAASGTGKEPGVACEACHGRGSAHVKASAETRKTVIVNAGTLETPVQQVSICAQCHARYTPVEGEPPVAFTPGEDLLAKVTLLPPEPGQTMQQVNELVHSKHFEQGVVCLTCHSAHPEAETEHQLRKPVMELCGGCHADKVDLTHTKGQAKAGDTCQTCHMPDGSHAFVKPTTP